jgi:hypothetical protein
VGNIADIARNHMDVAMWHGLTSNRRDVDADVEAAGGVGIEDAIADAVNKGPQCRLFIAVGVEIARDMATGHDEAVTGRDRVSVEDGEGQWRLHQYLGWRLAQGAVHRGD